MTNARNTLLIASTILMSLGCAGQAVQTQVATGPEQAVEQQYAAAVEEAFEAYEVAVVAAANEVYDSSAEAWAVSVSISPRYFDRLLAVSLEGRGLSVAGLADYATEHPEFMSAQQARYQGRMDRARAVAQQISERYELVQTMDEIPGMEEQYAFLE